MNKLEGLPTLHYISLEDSTDRRENLHNWFNKYGVTNYSSHLFKRFEESSYELIGRNVKKLDHHSKGPITSHLSLLKEWLSNSEDSFVMVIEDDLSLESVKYWGFTWREFFDNLPSDWGCVQLVIIRDSLTRNYFLEKRKDSDWCAAAYVMKRWYVEEIISKHYPENKFILDLDYTNDAPIVERILFSGKPFVYSFPLFLEDCLKTKSTLHTADEKFKHIKIDGQGEHHLESHLSVLNWWKVTGSQLSVEEIFQPVRRQKNEDMTDYYSLLSHMETIEPNLENFNFKSLKDKYNMNINGVIHVGAHFGQEVPDYIESGAKKVVLFEPIKETFAILSDKVNSLGSKVELHNVALGSERKVANMYVSDNEGQSSSLLMPSLHLTHHPNVDFPDIEQVDIYTLDSFDCSECNYLHMDVQGYELEVLKGALNTLNAVDYVYCEVNREEVYEGNAFVHQIDEFLGNYGFSRVETFWMGGIWGDALYIKKKPLIVSETCQIPSLKPIFETYFREQLGVFVEVGAFDGETFSNTSGLADSGWKGVYIEPISDYCELCKERHRANNVDVRKVSIGSKEGEVDLYVSGYLSTTNPALPEIYSSIEWAKDFKFQHEKCIQTRLDTLLIECNIQPFFELLVVDVEGNEEDVFNSFDLSYWKPQLMIVELVDEHPSFQEHYAHIQSNKRLRQKILEAGYLEAYKDTINTVFVSGEVK